MKKVITTLLLLALVITSSFAANVNILSKSPESNVTAILKYNNQTINSEAGLQITASQALDTPVQHSTNIFSVLINSNKSTNTNLIIDISATPFVSDSGYNSLITPVTNSGFNKYITVLAGIHVNEQVSQFSLNWTGKEGLPPGQYNSDVTITISAN